MVSVDEKFFIDRSRRTANVWRIGEGNERRWIARWSDGRVDGSSSELRRVCVGGMSEGRGMRSDAVVLEKQAKSMIINRSSNR